MDNPTVILNGRYKILEQTGSGGMAAVYKAEDALLGRIVAVKMLHEGFSGDEVFVRQFQHEAHAAANLTHPNIVTVHDIGQHDHRSYIVMEFVAGQTLKQLVREQTRDGRLIPINRVIDLVIQICTGIGYAHRSGLVHCDVKPQNVIVTPDERIKVADFGIARAMSQASRQYDGVTWGTPQYFSPEQAAGESATPASDVYAIGVILFELLSGRLPFEADTPTAVALMHLQEPPPPISHFNPNVPAQLENILFKILSKEPAGRYRTAGQLGRILTSYRQRSQQETAHITAAPQRPLPPTHSNSPPPARKQFARQMPAIDPATAAAVGEFDTTERYVNGRDEQPTTDWTAIGLSIAALLALIGLIPLWYFVALAWGVF